MTRFGSEFRYTLLHSATKGQRPVVALTAADTRARARTLRHVAIGVLLVGALALRVGSVLAGPFWADEAETGINAFSILQTGLPRSEYLGIPVYENMVVREWPSQPEYEFKDIS